MPEQQDSEVKPSISALRSKFESLAASGGNPRTSQPGVGERDGEQQGRRGSGGITGRWSGNGNGHGNGGVAAVLPSKSLSQTTTSRPPSPRARTRSSSPTTTSPPPMSPRSSPPASKSNPSIEITNDPHPPSVADLRNRFSTSRPSTPTPASPSKEAPTPQPQKARPPPPPKSSKPLAPGKPPASSTSSTSSSGFLTPSPSPAGSRSSSPAPFTPVNELHRSKPGEVVFHLEGERGLGRVDSFQRDLYAEFNDRTPTPTPTNNPILLSTEIATPINGTKKPPKPPPPMSRSKSSAPPLGIPTGTALSVPPQARSASVSKVLGGGGGGVGRAPRLPRRDSAEVVVQPRRDSGEVVIEPEEMPPPIPGNRPVMAPVAPVGGVAAPPLPTRQKTLSASSSAAPPPLPGRAVDPPPRHPVRQETDTLPRPPVRQETIPTKPLTVPMNNRARAISIGSRGGLSTSPGKIDGYIPPPPPVRAAGSPKMTRVLTREEGSSDEEGEEGDEEGVVTPTGSMMNLSASAKRAMEEYPDTSHASRRPPEFVPKQAVGTGHSIHSYAVSGGTLCVGAHNVKVYDMTSGEGGRLVMTQELRGTGLDFRGKEGRVTAMVFRPALGNEGEGRFLWCGTNAGHIWEFDTLMGEVGDTKALIHATPVIGLWRHNEWVVSMEENGRCHVFGPFGRGVDPEAGRVAVVPHRTIRTAEKQNFAKLIGGQLWTSTPPAQRTLANGGKGPTVRVYEPLSAAGEATTARTTQTSEWAGSVTSATIIPSRPGEVYLGHEGGYVSVFSRETLACLSVIKIWGSDVLALEGVGGRIWAGGRGGGVQVFEVGERPWRCMNSWVAHADRPVVGIQVDASSIAHTGRFAVWTLARDGLHAWDGLLSVDWIESEMLRREAEYCSFRDLNILICTWNIGSCKPTDLSSSAENQAFFADCLGSVESPDVIVFGLQEVIDLENKKLTAKAVLFGGKNKSDQADKISGAYRNWSDKIVSAVRSCTPPDCSYAMIHSESLVGLLSVVMVKTGLKGRMRDVSLTTIKRGLNGIYGNKGAIAARFVIDDTSICFINVHLAAGQRQKAARTADVAAILEEKAVFPCTQTAVESYVDGGDGMSIMDHEMVFFSGDLNYRIDQRRDNVLASVHSNDLAFLLEHDQLKKEVRTNPAFRLRMFEEAPITFDPTYKYDVGTQEYDMSEKMRIPAWCDRILHRTRNPARIKNLNYRRYEPTVSDHRPVSGGFKVTVKSIQDDQYAVVRRSVEQEWRKHESKFLEEIDVEFRRVHNIA